MIDARDALDAIGRLPDTEIDIADAALQAARLDAPETDWLAARAVLSALARDAVAQAAEIAPDDLSAPTGFAVTTRLTTTSPTPT
jgi:hypothetical protein